MRRLFRLLFVLGAASGVVAGELPRGELLTVEVRVAPEYSYALYLPSHYDPDARWPVLYCLDARSRGSMVAEVFRDAAEKYGWILACSADTLSDTADDPNTPAFRYLWYDTHQRLSIDDERIYATGFSGLSRYLWLLPSLNVPLAGVIGVGGSTPWPELPASDPGFAYYGIVGREDFNWAEMQILAHALEARELPHRLASFDGEHDWPDPATAGRAIAWMELLALPLPDRAENAGRDFLSADRAELDELIEEGHLAEAADLADWIARDYGEPGAGVLTGIDRSRLERAARDRDLLAKEELDWIAAAQKPIGQLLARESRPVDTMRARRLLDLKGWVRKRDGGGDQAHSASRRLSAIFGQLSYYLPNMFLDENEPDRALAALELAAEIQPSHPRVSYQRARVLTALGRHDAAVDALEEALRLLGRPGNTLAADENFAALDGNERFQNLTKMETPP